MHIKSTLQLNSGYTIPRLGLGVFKAALGDEAYNAVMWAFEAGYRHIDTARAYGNEKSVGRAIADCGIPREEIFVTTKLWNQDMRDERQEKAIYQSLDALGLDYIDLYLIHWPVNGHVVSSWKVMEKLCQKGLIRSIGLSNFHQQHYEMLKKEAVIEPAVNQIELHPLLTQDELVAYFQARGIAIEAWSPLGQGKILSLPLINDMAAKYGKTPAQIVIRWHLQKGYIVFPKSSNIKRIKENADVFDFEIVPSDMARIDAQNQNQRTGADPDNFNF